MGDDPRRMNKPITKLLDASDFGAHLIAEFGEERHIHADAGEFDFGQDVD